MINEIVTQHLNAGLFLQHNKAFFALRYALMHQIADLETYLKNSIVGNDVVFKRKLLPSLKRTLRGLQARFERAGRRIDARECANIILDWECAQYGRSPLQACQYYKGEERNPFEGKADDVAALFWDYERVWATDYLNNRRYLESELTEYIERGMMDFAESDGTPTTLKVILFNRYQHWSYYCSNEGFKTWYLKHYKRQEV